MKLETKVEFFQDDTHSITLDSIRSYDDGSGYSALLTIHSKPFACINHQFNFQNLKSFLKDVIKANESLKGVAEIGPTWDQEHIKFKMKSRGNVDISGRILSGSVYSQLLKFSFETDQSYFGSFAKSAGKALKELKGR